MEGIVGARLRSGISKASILGARVRWAGSVVLTTGLMLACVPPGASASDPRASDLKE